MSAPFVSGVAALVRSVNPLLSMDDTEYVLRTNASTSNYSNQTGWGYPLADNAVTFTLGVSNRVQVENRVIPLFSMYSSIAEDIAQFSKPQVALAFHINPQWDYEPYQGEAIIEGYTFPESPDNPQPADPRGDLFILSTHRDGAENKPVLPIHRMRWVEPYGGNPFDANWVIVLEDEIAGPGSFHEAGYSLDGLEGYIYELCSPEPDCMPTGSVGVYRAYNPSWDDHAVFQESKIPEMMSIGFTEDLTILGYAYPNTDGDGDGLVDGLERVLGTNPNSQDSDCDGIDDGVEYPFDSFPTSDPMDGFCAE